MSASSLGSARIVLDAHDELLRTSAGEQVGDVHLEGRVAPGVLDAARVVHPTLAA